MIALQLISMMTKLEEWSLIRKIDETTRSNATLLMLHGSTLYAHERNFEAILDGAFSREFSEKIKRKLDEQK